MSVRVSVCGRTDVRMSLKLCKLLYLLVEATSCNVRWVSNNWINVAIKLPFNRQFKNAINPFGNLYANTSRQINISATRTAPESQEFLEDKKSIQNELYKIS